MQSEAEKTAIDDLRELATRTATSGRRFPTHYRQEAQQTADNDTQVYRSTEAILAERQSTHGDFTDNARAMQALKRVLWAEAGWERLTDVQREALEMILCKVGRIISGNPNERDHWDDIVGYARLASQRVNSD